MDHFNWKAEYSVGVPEIDHQHQFFLDLINRLNDDLAEADEHEYRASLLNELVNYAKFHFLSEENIIKRLGISELEHHKKSHRKLIQQLNELIMPVQAGVSPAELVLTFIGAWLIEHTIKEDKKIFTTK
jgi:hemerythrin